MAEQKQFPKQKVIEKDDTFNPPKDVQVNFTKLQKTVECLFEGVFIIGTDILFH